MPNDFDPDAFLADESFDPDSFLADGAPRPTVEDLYAQEQEAIDNQPYLSPEAMAATEASLMRLRAQPPQRAAPAPQPPQAQEPSGIKKFGQGLMGVSRQMMGGAVTPFIKPYINKAQEKYGRPVAQGVYDALDTASQFYEGMPVTGTRVEPELRAVLSPLGGEDFRKGSVAGEEALKKDLSTLPGVGKPDWWSPSPETAAAVVKEGFASAPTMAATAGIQGPATKGAEGALRTGAAALAKSAPAWAARLEKTAPFLSRLVGAGAEAAAGGFVEGILIKSKDPLTEAVVQGAAGIAFQGALEGAAKVGKKILNPLPDAVPKTPKTVGIITKEAQGQVAEDVTRVMNQMELDAPEGALEKTAISKPKPTPHEVAAGESAPVTTAKPEELTPFMAVARVGPDGKPKVAVVEVTPGQAPKVAEFDAATGEARQKLYAYMERKGLKYINAPADTFDNPKVLEMLDEQARHVYGKAVEAAPSKISEAPVTNQVGTRAERPKSKEIAPPDPDNTYVREPQTALIQQNPATGKLTLRDTQRTDASMRPAAEPPPSPPGGGNLGPPPPPRPPPPPGPGDMDPAFNDDVAGLLNGVEKFSGEPGLIERAIRGLVGGHNRGPKDAAALIAMARGQQALEAGAKETYNFFRRMVPAKDWDGLGREVLRYAKGEKNSHVLEQKYPQIWGRVKADVDHFLQERDLHHQMIEALGGIPDDLAKLMENGVVDKYMARQYLVHLMPPGDWAKHVRKHKPELLETAAKFFLTDKAFKDWTHDQMAAELTRILQAQDPLDAFRGSPLARGKSSQRLLKRGEIPEPLRALMGEVENGFFRLAQTAGAQRAIVSNLKMWREIAQNPQMFARAPTPGVHHPVPLPNSKRHFGDAAGGYVTPHLYEELVNVPAAIDSGPRWVQELVRWGKFNEVVAGGPTPWLNATVGNLFLYSTYAGGISALRPKHAKDYWYRALRSIQDFSKNGGRNADVLDARQIGVDGPGVGGFEISGSSLADDLISHLPKENSGTFLDVLRGLGDATRKGAKKGKDWLSAEHDLIDRTFKVANYLALKDKFVAKGMPLEEARRLAARRVNESFPAPDKMGRWVQKAVRGPAGLVARYGTFFAEDLRIHLTLAKRLVEEPDLRARMLGMGIVGGALFGLGGYARRELGGIPDEEVEKVEAAMSDGKKYYRPLTWVLPWRDSRGRPQMVDLTSYFPMARLLQGHPDDAMYRRVLANLITSAADGGLAEGPVQEFLVRTGLIKGHQQRDFLQHEPKVLQVMQTLWDLGIAPKGPERIYEALRQGEAFGPVGPSTEPFTPEQAFAKATGGPMLGGVTPTPAGPSAIGSAFEYKAQLSQLEAELQRADGMDPNQAPRFLMALYQTVSGETPSQMKEAKIQRIQQAIQALAAKQSQRNTTLGGQP